jgi:hypothetical protein
MHIKDDILEATLHSTTSDLPFDMYTYLSSVRFFRLGRHALLAALNILKLCPGDRVLVPAFICRDLLAPIHTVGAVPVFYEVGLDMKSVNLPEVDCARAVLAVNYFGFPQDLLPFYSYCERHGATLIEDNAHGFLSCDETGTPLGERGDFGIFSIRKTFALPDSAMLMVNKAGWQNRLQNQLLFCSESLPLSFHVKRRLSWLQRKTGIKLLAMGQDFARLVRYWRTGHAIAPLLPENEFEMPMNPAPHLYSMTELPKLDLIEEVSRRRRLYSEFHDRFSTLNIKSVFGSLSGGTVPYGYPFYADEQSAQGAIRLARKQGFDCIRWPDLPADVVLTAPSHYRSLWMVNFIC